MSVLLDEIEQQALTLSAEGRARLAELLLELLDERLSETELAWAEEVERRVAAFDRGEMRIYPAEEVFAEARQYLGDACCTASQTDVSR